MRKIVHKIGKQKTIFEQMKLLNDLLPFTVSSSVTLLAIDTYIVKSIRDTGITKTKHSKMTKIRVRYYRLKRQYNQHKKEYRQ